MSWNPTVKRITSIHPIEGADSIELAIIGNGWPVVVRKGQYTPNQLVSYFCKDTIIPESFLKEWGLDGKLAGPNKNRVKPIRLRGQLSIGIICPAPNGFNEDDSIIEYYGLTEYVVPVPVCLAGKARNLPSGFSKYDLDNIRSYDPFIEGEEVIIEEKCDGSNFSACIINNEFYVNGRNLSIVQDETNAYWCGAAYHDLENKMRAYAEKNNLTNFWVIGELLPVQKFTYGLTELQIRFYEVKIDSKFLDYDDSRKILAELDLPTPPVLYRGPYNKSLSDVHSTGMETLSGKSLHIREGCVIRPVKERFLHSFGRVIVKCVNPEYLLKHDHGQH